LEAIDKVLDAQPDHQKLEERHRILAEYLRQMIKTHLHQKMRELAMTLLEPIDRSTWEKAAKKLHEEIFRAGLPI